MVIFIRKFQQSVSFAFFLQELKKKGHQSASRLGVPHLQSRQQHQDGEATPPCVFGAYIRWLHSVSHTTPRHTAPVFWWRCGYKFVVWVHILWIVYFGILVAQGEDTADWGPTTCAARPPFHVLTINTSPNLARPLLRKTTSNPPIMNPRTYESHMDWEYQGQGPCDPSSPFTHAASKATTSGFGSYFVLEAVADYSHLLTDHLNRRPQFPLQSIEQTESFC